MKPAKTDGNQGRREQEPGTQVLCLNQFGKFAARRLLSIGLKVHGGGGRY